MARWVIGTAIVIFSLFAGTWTGGLIVGAAAAETHVVELLATCLSCGEHWLYTPSATFGAGLLTLIGWRQRSDRCPKCRSRAVTVTHPIHRSNRQDPTA